MVQKCRVPNVGYFKKGEHPWNKGLTASTDVRVAIISQKAAISRHTTWVSKRTPKQTLEELYCKEQLSVSQIALKLGKNKHTIYGWMHDYDIKLRSLSEARKLLISSGYHDTKYGKRNRHFNFSGYILVPISSQDFFFPMAHSRRLNNEWGWVLEHRLVMARSLGRLLHPWEDVHHRNSNKSDNRLENLRLVLKGPHNGKVKCPHCHKEFAIR